MAYAYQRESGRWTGMYRDLEGVPRSAGTYLEEWRALDVARAQENFVREGPSGKLSPAEKAQVTIDEYWSTWLRSHRVEPSTKKTYRAICKAHIVDAFGELRVSELEREQVRDYITEVSENGGGVSTQRAIRAVLSAMMQTAWDDGYRKDNPIRGIKVDKKVRKKITVMTHAEFGKVYAALPTEGAKMFADVVVSTACRIDEGTVLLVSDWNPKTRKISFSKALQDAASEFYKDGTERFHIGETKTHEWREVMVGKQTAAALDKWIADNGLEWNDLLFPLALVRPEAPSRKQERVEAEGDFVAANGRTYAHGTINAYITGKCRCVACRQASSDYQLARKGKVRAEVKPRRHNPWLSDDSWRAIWVKACRDSQIGWSPTAYQLRHTCASWLIEAGESIQKVRERLGHASLNTTSVYVHHTSDDESSADILDEIRAW